MIYHRGRRERRGKGAPGIFLCALCVLCVSINRTSNAVEYLPGVAWPEPEVVMPGKSNSEPPSDAVMLFDGKDLSAWNDDGSWTVEDGVMIVGNRDIRTKQKFGSCQVHLEWQMPNPPKGKGQQRGNSGIYFMPHYERERDLFWKYEIQILDSYDNKTYFDGQAGAIYKQSPPMVNAMRPPGEWNVYDLIFVAPKFQDDGSLESPAYVTLIHNGVLVQNHFEMAGPTSYIAPPAYTGHAERLPIGLQNHGQKVRYRNIWVREISPIVGTKEHVPLFRAGGIKWRVGEERPKE